MQEIDGLSWQNMRMGKSSTGRDWFGPGTLNETPNVSAILHQSQSKKKSGKSRGINASGATSRNGGKRGKPEQSAESLRVAEITAASCNRRVRERRRENMRRARYLAKEKLAKAARSKKSSESGPALASQRLRRAEERKRVRHENMVEDLALRQLTSMDALNVMRFLSPRFEENKSFKPELKGHSEDNERFRALMAED